MLLLPTMLQASSPVPQVGSPNHTWPPPLMMQAVTSTPPLQPACVTQVVSPPLLGTVAGVSIDEHPLTATRDVIAGVRSPPPGAILSSLPSLASTEMGWEGLHGVGV